MASHHLACVVTFFCSQSFPALRSFPVNWFFTSGGQSIEVSASDESFQWIFRLISFRNDWLNLLAVQGTLKSLLQHHSSKASIPQRSAFFTVQFSHPYVTTGKTIALTRRTLVCSNACPWWLRHKDCTCNAGDQVQALGWEDPLEKVMATHSSILAWRIPWTEEPGGLESIGLQRVRYDWETERSCTHAQCEDPS